MDLEIEGLMALMLTWFTFSQKRFRGQSGTGWFSSGEVGELLFICLGKVFAPWNSARYF